MKFVFVILLIAIRSLVFSQKNSEQALSPLHPVDTIKTEIQLNKLMDTLNCGYWKTGDYTLYIKLQPFLESLQMDYSGLTKTMNTIKNDSVNFNRYHVYAARYLKTIHQLKNAENTVDLRQVVLYLGPENAERNKGNSVEVELFVRNALENGNAAVFYKNQRVFKLTKRTVKDYVMSNIKIYFEDDSNYAFSYFGYINW